jgi:Tol biopolymer transport system component
MANRYLGLGLVTGAGLAATLGGVSGCGDSFGGTDCASSHTCSGAAAGEGGQGQGDETSGGSAAKGGASTAGSANVGGAGGDNTGAGGEGGDQPTVVGMPCAKDAECDDGDSCTGKETCVDGLCAAGKVVECPAGLACSAAKNDACVFKTNAPWILYIADGNTKGVKDLYGIKSDLLGTMLPVKLTPTLDTGWAADAIGPWSPDGTSVVFTTVDTGAKHHESYLVSFGDGLPPAAVQLTKGTPASAISIAQWSPSNHSVLVTRDDGLYVVDIAANGTVAESKATPDGYALVGGWIKSDNEIAYIAKAVVTNKVSAALADRDGGAWTRQPLVADIGNVVLATATEDRSQLAYVTLDAQSLQTLWSVEAVAGSTPSKLAGPAYQAEGYSSPNSAQYLLATTDKVTQKTTMYGGALATLSAPPIIKQNIALTASQSLGVTAEGPWAPDSSAAALFEEGAYGKRLVIYQPGAATPWQETTETQALQGQFAPLWSPSSKTLVLETQASADADYSLKLLTAPTTFKTLDSAPAVSGIYPGPFSAGGEFLVYSTSAGGRYVDLRQGADKAPDPIALPGIMGAREFSTTGLGFVYIRGAENCFFVDFSGVTPSDPVQVNAAGVVSACGFQKLPK